MTITVDLQAQLDAALLRIAQLENELANRPKKRAASSRTKVATGPDLSGCQYCGDIKTEKGIFLGLPMCAGAGYEWKKCASRIRRNTVNGIASVAYAYDLRYRVRKEDDRYVARFNGEVIAIADTQSEARALAHRHWGANAEQPPIIIQAA